MPRKLSIDKLLFAATVWIFLSQNAKMFNFGIYGLLRWIIPIALLLITAVINNGKIAAPFPLIIAFVAAVAPSFLYSIDIGTSISKAASFVLITYSLYVYFMGKTEQKETENVIRIALGLILLFQLLNIIFCIVGMGSAGNGRYNGFTTNSNTLGIYSNLAFWSSYYFIKKTKGLFRIFFWFMLVTSIVLALLSGSRSAFVIILLNIIISVYLNTKSSITRIIVTILILIMIYLLLSGKLSILHISALDRLLAEEGMTRGEIWATGLNVWKEHPIFGCGYRISKLYDTNFGTEGMDFHNSYISLLAEIGLWGVLVFGIPFISQINRIRKEVVLEIRNSTKRILTVVSFMALSLMICAWSESFLFSVGSTEAFCFWMFFVWMIAFIRKGGMQYE